MKLHLCGLAATLFLLAGCGQMGPLVLPPKAETAAPVVKTKTPVTVQSAAPQTEPETPTSGVNPAPATPNKDTP